MTHAKQRNNWKFTEIPLSRNYPFLLLGPGRTLDEFLRCRKMLPAIGLRSFSRQLKYCSFGSHLTTKLQTNLSHQLKANNLFSLVTAYRAGFLVYIFLFLMQSKLNWLPLIKMKLLCFWLSIYTFLTWLKLRRCITQIRVPQAQILTLKWLQLYIIALMAIPEQLPCPVPLPLIVRITWRVIHYEDGFGANWGRMGRR